MKSPTGLLIGERSSCKTSATWQFSPHDCLIALISNSLCIIQEDLCGRRSITDAIQVCPKTDGLKSVSVCYMFSARKTDGYD